MFKCRNYIYSSQHTDITIYKIFPDFLCTFSVLICYRRILFTRVNKIDEREREIENGGDLRRYIIARQSLLGSREKLTENIYEDCLPPHSTYRDIYFVIYQRRAHRCMHMYVESAYGVVECTLDRVGTYHGLVYYMRITRV